MDQQPEFYHDPDGKKRRAREGRIAQMMQQANGYRFTSDRYYCELVYDNEEAPFTTDAQQLAAAGFSLPPAETLDDAQLATKLAELIEELARMHVYLNFTDHLSDRELYCRLVEQSLNVERRDIPMTEHAAWQLDLSGFDEGADLDDELVDAPTATDARCRGRRSR